MPDRIYSGLEKRISPEDAHCFFGYFDKFPVNGDGRHLAHRIPFAGRQPKYGEKADIGIAESGVFEKLGETRAWCWQQGSMLQWFDDRRFIYNDVKDDRHIARLSDGTEFSRPVYTLSGDRRYALSVNFSRLDAERPGYGYPGLPDPAADYAYPDFDGIWLMDLQSGENKLVVSLEDLARKYPAPNSENCCHWTNHLLFSPDGEKFAFIHRFRMYLPSDHGKRFYTTRMFTANRDGSNLTLLPIDFHASHYTWRDNESLLVFSRLPSGGDQYRIYPADGGEPRIIACGRLPSNGHCSFSPDGRLLLTDSYPDEHDMRELVVYDPGRDCRYSLGRFFSPSLLPAARCDLHPRWMPDGKAVSFDSFHEKYRGIYIIQLPDEVLS